VNVAAGQAQGTVSLRARPPAERVVSDRLFPLPPQPAKSVAAISAPSRCVATAGAGGSSDALLPSHGDAEADVKTAASRRIVSIPAALIEEVRHHLDTFAAVGQQGAVFVGRAGGRLRRTNFRKYSWIPATQAVGVDGVRFHDLRHTGNTLAASTGASTRELMARMGHASARAALIHQHATRERDAVIASALSDVIDARVRHARRL
jgi:integrase